jgi:organic hydroperoxide reductase OsmC/OhrA
MTQHHYQVRTEWTGNDGEGTKTYKSYRRDHVIRGQGKPEIPGSSDPNFRGDRARYNPEELLVASLSSCHMLWYLHLCAISVCHEPYGGRRLSGRGLRHHARK